MLGKVDCQCSEGIGYECPKHNWVIFSLLDFPGFVIGEVKRKQNDEKAVEEKQLNNCLTMSVEKC